jgi:hypothetical protein
MAGSFHHCIALALLLGLLGPGGPAWADPQEKAIYRDFYLKGDRICKRCTGEWADKHHVRLTNREGHTTIVPSREIIGVDLHPAGRKLFRKSLHGTGLAAKVIVPYAFDDYKDFVCKYCDP